MEDLKIEYVANHVNKFSKKLKIGDLHNAIKLNNSNFNSLQIIITKLRENKETDELQKIKRMLELFRDNRTTYKITKKIKKNGLVLETNIDNIFNQIKKILSMLNIDKNQLDLMVKNLIKNQQILDINLTSMDLTNKILKHTAKGNKEIKKKLSILLIKTNKELGEITYKQNIFKILNVAYQNIKYNKSVQTSIIIVALTGALIYWVDKAWMIDFSKLKNNITQTITPIDNDSLPDPSSLARETYDYNEIKNDVINKDARWILESNKYRTIFTTEISRSWEKTVWDLIEIYSPTLWDKYNASTNEEKAEFITGILLKQNNGSFTITNDDDDPLNRNITLNENKTFKIFEADVETNTTAHTNPNKNKWIFYKDNYWPNNYWPNKWYPNQYNSNQYNSKRHV